jgi:hypothetical protein
VQHRWTGGQLKRLSKCLRDGLEPVGDVPDYGDVMLFYNDVAVQVEQRIDEINWTELLGGVRPEVTSRAKSIDTLREKLQREPSTPLPSVQDVAGVRFEADMTLDEQDAVVERLMEAFGDSSVVRDLRKEPTAGIELCTFGSNFPSGWSCRSGLSSKAHGPTCTNPQLTSSAERSAMATCPRTERPPSSSSKCTLFHSTASSHWRSHVTRSNDSKGIIRNPPNFYKLLCQGRRASG